MIPKRNIIIFLAVTVIIIIQAAYCKSEDDDNISNINKMDETVNNILAWLQNKYIRSRESLRKVRQENLSRNYLPSLSTLRPRPFESTTAQAEIDFPQTINEDLSNENADYPTPSEITPPDYLQSSNFNDENEQTPLTDFDNVYDNQPFTPNENEENSLNPISTIDEINNISADINHPPHIHSLNVQCSKESMIITVDFNRVFNGLIYSKGHYQDTSCRYVQPNSNRNHYTFTVQLNSCGTQFIDEFALGKSAYLENVLVVQNEVGFQEVWDIIRTVRCLWEGQINKELSKDLNVDGLNQEIVTFSGDTATANLDIQVGRGPFAPSATGLVKIGEIMTLVIIVNGDPAFTILPRRCIAKSTLGDQLELTDDRGCVVKPKIMGAFQTTTDEHNGQIIAYAFFQAFKFPDAMDLKIDCNVELCKGPCDICPEENQKIDPGRKRRSTNSTVFPEMKISKLFHVFLPDDISENLAQPINDSVCLSKFTFIFSSIICSFTLLLSSICAFFFCFKYNKQKKEIF